MKQRVTRIDPVQLAKIVGVLYALAGLVVLPVFALLALFGDDEAGISLLVALLMGCMLPFIYAVMGAAFALVAAWIYNLLAPHVGGIEFDTVTVVETAPGSPPPPPPSPPAAG